MSRILHVLGSARAEGTPRLVLDWLSLDTHEQAVALLSPEFPDLQPALQTAAKAFFVGAVQLQQGGRPRRAKTAEIVSKAMDVFRPDVVVCWVTWAAGTTGQVLRNKAAKCQLVVHCGNPAAQSLADVITADLKFLPAYRANAYFACCSDYVRDSFRRRTILAKSRFQTIPNCAQIERITARAAKARMVRVKDKTRFIMVGTMEGHKDQSTLVQAAALLAQRRQDFEVLLAGGGKLIEKIKGQIATLGMAGMVMPLGMRTDIPELLGQSDAFVFSTTSQEGFGTVFIEALAAGLPVIASDVPACREALANGSFGRLVQPQDAQALAGAMLDFMENPAPFVCAGTKAATYVKNFSPAAMANAYLSLPV
jgi:glycosyltransferase involved in cell wall biosynthesis